MKKKSITFLLSFGLVLSGCSFQDLMFWKKKDKTPDSGDVDDGGDNDPQEVTPEEIPEGDVFFSAKNKLYENHNYTVKVTTTVEDDNESPYVDRFYNINNKAYFAVNSEYPAFYYGFIYQKNQGYVDFDLLISGNEVVPSDFYSTDPSKSVSDIYTLAVERILNGHFLKEGDTYSCDEKDPIAVATNLSGFDTTYITAPEKIYINVKEGNIFEISCDFQIWYIDESTVEKVTKQGNVKIEFENINTTHNAAIEAYIQNPTTTFSPKLDWSTSDRKEFDSYFNGRIPPFLEESSYSLKVGNYYDGYNQEKYAIIEDYACGDKSEPYGEILEDNGYTKVDNYHYQMKQIFASGSMEETYYVDMIFTAPNVEYSGDRTVGYYFPNGVFTIKYRYKTKPTEEITTIAKLNTHISKSKARTILPAFPDNGEIERITNFEDRTAYANQYYSPEERAFLFVTSVSSLIVKLHATKENAIAFINNLTPLMEEKGFVKNVDSRYGQISYIDAQQSKVVLTNPEFEGATEEGITYVYPGYIQLQIVIYNAYGDIVDPSEVLEGITLSNQTKAYHVGDTFRFDGIVTAHYQSGDTKVVFPNSVTSPDMSTAGNKVVTVSYTEDGQTVTKGYSISVTYPDSATAKTIQYASGFDHEAVEHIDLANSVLPERAEPGETVTMTVAIEDGYRFGCFYPNDETGDVWAQFYDEPVRTKTVSFTMPEYSFEMILIVELDDGSPIPDYPMRMEITGYSTEFYEYGDFSFDGICTVTYESGNTATVTPTVLDYPNMSQLGTQTVHLEYFESGVTVRTSYDISVVERPPTPKYTVSTISPDGAQITNLKATSGTGTTVQLNQVEEGFRISFNVAISGGYTVDRVYYEFNGVKTTINKSLSGSYSFYMPAGDVTIGVDTTPPEILQNLDGIFAFQADDHNVYEFNFNASTRTGTYTRINTTSSGTNVWSLNFSFSYLAGQLTLTLVSFSSGSDSISFSIGYRLFPSGELGSTNNSLSMNAEGDTITLTMYKNSGVSETETHSFYKD